MEETHHVVALVRGFVEKKFPSARKRAPNPTDDLLESGVIDSLGVLDLVAFLEKEFGLTISDDELTPENFGSIEQMAAFVSSKDHARSGHAG